MKKILSQYQENANLGLTDSFKIKGNSEMININSLILQMGSDKGHNLPEDAYLKMTRTRT